ncbi:glycoside hydrolase family 5 protein [Phanerochaete carnosa HHB-10118-sp]|uniref:glucan 1,3-beta-glucosidase n=1 Tax=Phanerochaete carnosa (strain HHB-10118-sp) TaxID=650164 RepID=K5UUG1_PHACS|nr:glycoside hydrolase family 5 protein [Phanerochaete carnosa HHB-10118-sp]EKM53646.1 glycoside hydrolase family 5 protein [Phanerochaete carnosa HHB-10118-sp]
MSNHQYAEVPSGSRPVTTTDSDFDAYGTPTAGTPIVAPMPLGHDGMPAPVPSAFSLSSTTTPRDSTYNPYGEPMGTPNNNSAPLLQHSPADAMYGSGGKEATYLSAGRKRPFYKRPWFYLLLVVAVVVIALAVALPVTLIHKHDGSSASGGSSSGGGGSGGGGGGGGGGKGSTALATSGGNGSTITTDDGSTFVYNNPYGGFWVSDPSNPFNNSARPNSWTPPISGAWTWGQDHIFGVNLGGLFVLEPFIVPSLFQSYPSAVDEWTLSEAIVAAGQNLTQVLEDHYSTFIQEEDIAQIAGAGLNWIRLPIPFWAIEAWQDVGVDPGSTTPVAEPFLAKVCWQYILRVLAWCRKYGLRVNLDLHTIPGSQNGYNHSGRLGQVNFMAGIMGYANAQRALDYIRTITEFVSQPEYIDLIPVFSIVNEALVSTIGIDQITSFYLQAHDMIRGITGLGEGNGPFIVIHDGFLGINTWSDFLQGSDRIMIDTHPYFAFDGQPNNAPIDQPLQGSSVQGQFGGPWPMQACNAWAASMNQSRENFGVTIAGEFSNGINDCGLWVRGVNITPSYAGNCTEFSNADLWTDEIKNGFLNFQLASMDALRDWFFWTWKIGNDSTGSVQSPLWSYQLGLQGGWIPPDPRVALGTCQALGVDTPQFNGSFQPWQTGGPGAGTIVPSSTSQFGLFPPTSIAGVPAGQVNLIPTYTSSRGPLTLPPPTFTATVTVSTGDGWFDTADTAQYVTAVANCEYPDAWSAQNSPVPATACGAMSALGGAAPVTTTPVATPAVPPAATTAPQPTAPGAVLTSISSTAPAVSRTTSGAGAVTTSTSVPVVPPAATVRR